MMAPLTNEELWELERQLDAMDQHLHQLLTRIRKAIGNTRTNKPGPEKAP